MMNRKLPSLFLTLCVLLPLLCGCAQNVPVSDADPTLTLPPAVNNYVAPIGDAALEYAAAAVLYLPRHSGERLTALTDEVTFSVARPLAESLVRALVSHSPTDIASALGGDVRLSLYGVNPVEVSGNVATVNLGASALQLPRDKLFIAFQAIANTLTELSDIDYVNFLVADHAVGLDVANTLPIGAMSRSVGEDLGAVYDQQLTRLVSITENAADKPLTKNVTLYFPLANTPGVISEVRTCSFANQLLPDMVTTVIRELGNGPQQGGINSPALPLLSDLLAAAPSAEYSSVLGGQVLTLPFSFNLDDMLEAHGLSRANSMASLCYTLTTFFPGVVGVRVLIGDQPVETLMLTESFTSSVLFTDQVQQRTDFGVLLYDLCTLYFSDPEGVRLVATERPIPYYQKNNPRFLLQELSGGPKSYDSVQGLVRVMPLGSVSDAEMLGFALQDDVILVNLASSFASLGTGMTGQQERLLAYAMVNTLCEDQRFHSACFFVSGAPPEGFSGEIYWPGPFYPVY